MEWFGLAAIIGIACFMMIGLPMLLEYLDGKTQEKEKTARLKIAHQIKETELKILQEQRKRDE